MSTPLLWDEVVDCRPENFTIATVPQRFAEHGDPWEGMDDAAGSLDQLLDLADRLGPAEKAPKGAKKGTGRRPSLVEAADRDRPHQDQGRGDGRSGYLA